MKTFQAMREYNHEEVVFCNDRDSGLRAIIAIHDTTLGPALGGTRMWPYKSEEEALNDVLRLSRGMTYKSAVAGLNFGGGKAVIIGDPQKDKNEVLFRAFGRFVQGFNGRFITGEDVGIEVRDMEWVRMETPWVLGISEALGGSGDPSPVTARGVYFGMKACSEAVFGTPELRSLIFSTKRAPRFSSPTSVRNASNAAFRTSAPKPSARKRFMTWRRRFLRHAASARSSTMKPSRA